MAANAQREAGSKQDQADKQDFFIRLTVEQGPKFFEGKKHGTTRELADLYAQYAKESDGVLKEVFSMFAKHLQAVLSVPAYAQNATGGYPDSAQWSPCGYCTLSNGQPGRTLTISVNSLASTDCYPCSGRASLRAEQRAISRGEAVPSRWPIGRRHNGERNLKLSSAI